MGDYYCGNSSAGGWVGWDDPRGDNGTQGLSPAMPYGFDYDETMDSFDFLASMGDITGAVMHVWRQQGWFVNMFGNLRAPQIDNARFCTKLKTQICELYL